MLLILKQKAGHRSLFITPFVKIQLSVSVVLTDLRLHLKTTLGSDG